MRKTIKIALLAVATLAGITIVAIAIYSIISSRQAETFKLKPGFRRRVAIINSVLPSQEISEECIRYDRWGNPEVFDSSEDDNNDGLYKHSSHTLILEDNFTSPVTITVVATASDTSKTAPDPAIVIKSNDGITLMCDDTEPDHGTIERLNTRDSVINNGGNIYPGFIANKGKYQLEIWTYYQPAQELEIKITEGI